VCAQRGDGAALETGVRHIIGVESLQRIALGR
jgi:hypothetical protein